MSRIGRVVRVDIAQRSKARIMKNLVYERAVSAGVEKVDIRLYQVRPAVSLRKGI